MFQVFFSHSYAELNFAKGWWNWRELMEPPKLPTDHTLQLFKIAMAEHHHFW